MDRDDLEPTEVEAASGKTRVYFVPGGFVGLDIVRTQPGADGEPAQEIRSTATYGPSEAITLAQGIMQLATTIMGPAEALKTLLSGSKLEELAKMVPPLDPDFGIVDEG